MAAWFVAAGMPVAGQEGKVVVEPTSAASSLLAGEAGLERSIESGMRAAGMVGWAGAILVDGKVVWTKGFGFADREAGRPFTPETVINVGSIAKTVVGVALMRAVEAGKLRLDDDVNLYLPWSVRNPRHPELPITLRQLATHTSGIADRDPVYGDSYHQGGDSPVALGDFLRDYFDPKGKTWSADNFTAAKPGSSREYSNIGAGLAAYAVERATGVPFPEATRNEIFRPLRMTQTGWFLSEIERSRHTKLYDASGAGSDKAVEIPLYGLATYPDGGLRTSVADLSRFFLALLGGGELDGVRILAPASAAEMMRLQFSVENRPENVVLAEKNSGIFWSTKMDVTYVGHGGTDPGVHAEMLAEAHGEPSKRVAAIVVTNTTLADGKMKPFFDIFKALIARGREIAGSSGQS
jgi:CubicO group peptidase (beta-lactamase class C family)